MDTPFIAPKQTPSADQARWFAEEVYPHEADLRSYLRGKFPSLFDLDDLIQETYARLFKARRAGKVSEARPYLFATARNYAVDLCRHNQVVRIESLAEMDSLSVVEDEPNAAESANREQELQLLIEAIHSLPDRCREVVVLRKIDQLSYREIAQKLGISENTVKVQVSLGVFRCRKYLISSGISRESLKQAKVPSESP